jgi:hypothetical protein
MPNELQHQLIIGGLLGDTFMELNGKYPRIQIYRQFLDYNYLNWQYEILKNFCKSGIKSFERYDKRYNTNYKYCSFRTKTIPEFLNYYNEWYPNGKKIVPSNLEFTPLILAIWFADDGWVTHSGKRSLSVGLATECFGEIGTSFLSKKLENRYNLKFPFYKKKKNQFFIKTGSEAAQVFLKEIQEYIIDMKMERKYNIWKNIPFIKPKMGVLYKNYNLIYKTILIVKDFSINELYETIHIYNVDSLRTIINNFCSKNYINKYEIARFPISYRYKITEQGEDFFKYPPIDDLGAI